MNPDNLQQVWQSQPSQVRLTINADLLLKEVQRNQRAFTATIFWRDAREVGIALALVPVWIYLGIKTSAPWMWYLTVPALVWIALFMLVDRLRHKRQPPEPGEPLRQRIEISLAQVQHQIWLLRNVQWWYLAPLAVPMLAFLGHLAWRERALGWPMALLTAAMAALVAFVVAAVYRLNQTAIRSELEPRSQELEALLVSLKDETAVS
jgi:hypothetical protein